MRNTTLLLSAAVLTAIGAEGTAQQQQFFDAGYGGVNTYIDAQAQTSEVGCLGCEELGGEFFVSSRSDGSGGPRTIWVYDGAGTLVRNYQQPTPHQGTATAWGIRDMATDGTSLLGGSEAGISVFDPQTGTTVNTVQAQNGPQTITQPITGTGLTTIGTYRALAFDPAGNGGNGSIWTASFGSDLLEVDLSGTILNIITNAGWSAYGLAMDPTSGNLWCNSIPNQGDIAEIDLVSGTPSGMLIPQAAPGFAAQGGLSRVTNASSGALAPLAPAQDPSVSWPSYFTLVELAQAGPDALLTRRIDLLDSAVTGIRGWDDAELQVGASGGTLSPNPGTISPGGTLDMTVNDPTGTVNGLPAHFAINVGAGADIERASTVLPLGFLTSLGLQEIPELVRPNALSVPADPGMVLLGGVVGQTLSVPLPPTLSLATGDRIAVQSIHIDPRFPWILKATNETWWTFANCSAFANFDALATGTGNYPTGWSNGGGIREWEVGTGGTPSTGTGPTGAVSPPNYMYCETSSPASSGDTYIMNTATYASSSLSSNTLSFQLNRLGTTVGTLEVRMDDGTGAFATLLQTYTGPEPSGIEWTQETLSLPTPLPANIQFQFHYTRSTSFTGDVAIDDVCLQ